MRSVPTQSYTRWGRYDYRSPEIYKNKVEKNILLAVALSAHTEGWLIVGCEALQTEKPFVEPQNQLSLLHYKV